MKKIISLGVASAICALTAISASAAPASFDAKGEVVNGGTITVDVLAGEDLKGLNFNVEVEGLELQSCEAGKKPTLGGSLQEGTNKWFASNGTDTIAKAGDVLCTITAKVTAKAGEKVSISLVSPDGTYTAVLPEQAWTAEVKGAQGGDSKPTESGDSKPTESGDSKPTESGDSKPNEGDKPNPPTGVALAVVPAVLAAAGVIVAKKRK